MTYSLIVQEDLDIGPGTRQLRLQDGSLVTAHQLSVAALAILKTATVSASNGASVLTLSALIPAGARVLGVTSQVLTAFGTGNGLTGINIGDATLVDRWAAAAAITLNALTEQGSFQEGSWPIYASATDVLVSAVGGTFTAVGQLQVTVHYTLLTHRVQA